MALFCDATVTDWSSRVAFESTTPSTSGPVTAPNSAAWCVATGDEVVAIARIKPDFVGASQVREHRHDRSVGLHR